MAEAHPVGFQWVMEAKRRGATIIHVDPRFTRTSALADQHVPIRAGSDIAFLGGLINYVLTNDAWFSEYVLAYTNASTIIGEDFEDTEDLAGLFSGFDADDRTYDLESWQYAGAQNDMPDEGRDDDDAEDEASETPGAAGARASDTTEDPLRDETLQHPHCVFQILKRHFSRYTPEMVERTCGVAADDFLRVARALTENSGRERTTAFCYAVGWTQHTVGVQYIRTAAILQLLLGNIGRPGGGSFVGWGSQPEFTEFDANGEVVLHGSFGDGMPSYRAFRLPWTGTPTDTPVAALREDGGVSTVYASWNGATEVRTWRVLAGPAPDQLRPVAEVGKTGFETSAALPAPEEYAAVEALDADGQVLSRSEPVPAGA